MPTKTIIVFIGDNGGGLALYANNGILKGGKFTSFEGGLRVPMIISHPDIKTSNMVSNAMVSALDLHPTICAMTGSEIPKNVDGINLSPMFNGEQLDTERRILYWDTPHQKAIRKGKWKLLINEGEPNSGMPAIHKVDIPKGSFLYDLAEDPGENKDLSSAHPEIKTRLIKRPAKMAG